MADSIPRSYRGDRAEVRVCACGCRRVFVVYDVRRIYFDNACKQAAYRASKRRRAAKQRHTVNR